MKTPDQQDAEWRDPANWRGGTFYASAGDPRVWVPKPPPGVGWTLNFARPASWIWLAVLLAVPIAIIAVAGTVVLGQLHRYR